jgi:hypothetical protein
MPFTHTCTMSSGVTLIQSIAEISSFELVSAYGSQDVHHVMIFEPEVRRVAYQIDGTDIMYYK